METKTLSRLRETTEAGLLYPSFNTDIKTKTKEFQESFGLYLPMFYRHGFLLNLGFDILKFERIVMSNLFDRFVWSDSESDILSLAELKQDASILSLAELVAKYYGKQSRDLLDYLTA